MIYRIELLKAAKKFLQNTSKQDRNRIAKRIDSLAKTPFPPGVKKLQGTGRDLYRVRQGNWRILYTVNDCEVIIVVVEIGHRREIYRS